VQECNDDRLSEVEPGQGIRQSPPGICAIIKNQWRIGHETPAFAEQQGTTGQRVEPTQSSDRSPNLCASKWMPA